VIIDQTNKKRKKETTSSRINNEKPLMAEGDNGGNQRNTRQVFHEKTNRRGSDSKTPVKKNKTKERDAA